MPIGGPFSLSPSSFPVGLVPSHQMSSSRWIGDRIPGPLVGFREESWRHFQARPPALSLHMRALLERLHVSFFGSSFSTQTEGPVYYILKSLSSPITLIWYHFCLLECHNNNNKKEVLEHDSTCQRAANTHLKYWIEPVSCDISGGNLSL